MSSPRSSTKVDLDINAPPLPVLPEEVIKTELYPRLPLDVLGLFAATSSDTEAQTAFLRLLSSAAPESYNQETQKGPTKLAAIAILKRHPRHSVELGSLK